MPLEKAGIGTPGFSRNVATEVKAGKSQKQAVAIAYKQAGERNDEAARLDALMDAVGRAEARLDALMGGRK